MVWENLYNFVKTYMFKNKIQIFKNYCYCFIKKDFDILKFLNRKFCKINIIFKKF